MNISEEIKYILDENTVWSLYKNKSYKAKIQKADKIRVYNVPDRPGVVYNHLEDSYAEVTEGGFVVTGIAGEMWPIGEGSLKKYGVTADELSFEPKEVNTIETDDVFCGVMIPKGTKFELETDYGQKVILNGNRTGIDHGKGDYIIIEAKHENGRYYPDFSKSGRIVNGAVFDKIYRLAGYSNETISAPFRPDEDDYIFVSYSHKDREKVFPIIKALYEKGFHIWYDEGIELCSDFSDSIRTHVQNCSLFLLFLTENSAKSPFINEKELPWSKEHNKQRLVCRLTEKTDHEDDLIKEYPAESVSLNDLENTLKRIAVNTKYGERKAAGYMIRKPDFDILLADESDLFWFKVCQDGIKLTPYSSKVKKICVPDTYKGFSVTEFIIRTKRRFEELRELHIAENVKKAVIECYYEDGFEADCGITRKFEDIYISGSETKIEWELANCYMYPDSIPAIKVHCPKGSEAEKWARRNYLTVINDCSGKDAEEHEDTSDADYAVCFHADDVDKDDKRVEVINTLKDNLFSLKECRISDNSEAEQYVLDSKCIVIFISKGLLQDHEELIEKSERLDKPVIYYILDDTVMSGKKQYIDIKTSTFNDRISKLGEYLETSGCRKKNFAPKEYEYIPDKNGRIVLTKYIGKETDIKISETITANNYPVYELLGTFRDNKSLKKAVVSEGISIIGNNTFAGCTDLEEAVIPETVKTVGENAFYQCESLRCITLSSGLKKIGKNAFYGCKDLKSIDIPSGVISIGKSAFSDCTGLESIVVPSGVTDIGSFAFGNCKSLKKIVLPPSVSALGLMSFSTCESLNEVRLPDGLKEIDELMFLGCVSMENIVIPSGVTVIEKGAFAYCKNLQSIEIPEGVTSIGRGAFAHCESLRSIKIPESVMSIGRGAFENCKNLERLVIPASVTAFDIDTQWLSNIYSSANEEYWSLSFLLDEEYDEVSEARWFTGCSVLTVYCDEGSAAWKYCEENDIPHEPIN